MEETTILEFESYLFGMKGNKEGILKIPKEYYELTNERLKVKKQGVMTQTKHDMDLYKINDIRVYQRLRDKAMNVGTIYVESSEAYDEMLVLKDVRDPHTVREVIRDATKKAKLEAGVTYRQEI
ncbi:PH domain-containing protein [Planococcus sp. A6]|uniref:PH domain-containing protein n=1 Tax=Planococcus sp. A6 TaxID=2992760 RepID=UPI00237B5730|nr:PH domain-containing protein [Planococcus sp. A6]MDE0582225.1 PH domain-containing protein [Planococcus sp. A6]